MVERGEAWVAGLVLLVALSGCGGGGGGGAGTPAARGPRIVFADAPGATPGAAANQAAHLFTVDTAGGDRRQLTSTPGSILPAYSPDGTRIAYTQLAPGRQQVWVIGSEGESPEHVADGYLPTWAPDGLALAYVREVAGLSQIFHLDLVSGVETLLTSEGRNRVPTFSPDGTRLAYWSGDADGFGQVWVMDRDGGGKRALTAPIVDGYTPDGRSANAPSWLYQDRIVFWAGVEHAYGQVFTIAPDGTDERQLTHEPAPASSDNPIWSPDGAHILFDTQRRGRVEVWVMDADGGNERPLIGDLTVIPQRVSWQAAR
jgi:TolB protein